MTNDRQELPPEVEADLLDRQAVRLEATADRTEESAARIYGGGSYSFICALEQADADRDEAQQLRDRAEQYRALAWRQGRTA